MECLRRVGVAEPCAHEEVFEMFFVVTGVRFQDDATWTAQEEELVLEP